MYLFAVLDLRCCAEAFCRCSKQGLLSSCGSGVSHCSDSCCRAQALGLTGFSSYDSRALQHRLNSCGAWA